MKKWLLIALIVVFLFSMLGFVACDENQIPEEPQYNMVILGDSIAEGIAGPSPISEREDHAYGSIVGQINGINYHNRSISGFQTFQMLDYISKETDESAYAHITHIKQADIIVISMFGNDYIWSDLNKLILEAAKNKSDLRDKVLNTVQTNIELIVNRLKELSPNAKILWQSLYNPIYQDSNILLKETYDVLKDEYNIYGDSLYELGDKLLDQLNQTLYTQLEKHPNSIEIVDVNKKFEDLYNADHEHIKTLIYKDGVHPSNEGHAYIASTLQAKLEELGYASKNALKNYKKLVSDRLNRLYTSTTVDLNGVTEQINAAKSFDEVNRVYFGGVKGVIPNYNHKTNELVSTENKRLMDEDTTFSLVYASFSGGINENLPIQSLIDSKKSFVKLGADGMLTMEVHINEKIYNLLKSIVSGLDASVLDLSFFDAYIQELFPGKSIDRIEELLKAIENTLGISVKGLDYNDPNIKTITDSLLNTGKLPEKIELPDEIYFTLSQPYELKHIDSLTVEGGFEAVYVGNYRGIEPYIMMTLGEDLWGVKNLKFINEFLFLTIEMEEVEE